MTEDYRYDLGHGHWVAANQPLTGDVIAAMRGILDGCRAVAADRAADREREHDLKTWPEHFAAVLDGSKTYEIRMNDRGFRVGDVLRLREWDPIQVPHVTRDYRPRGYTGRKVSRVTHVLTAGTFGLRPGYVALEPAALAARPAPVDGEAHCPTCICGRRAPVQGGRVNARGALRDMPSGTVAWVEHEQAYVPYAARFGTDQSAERLAERGGFGYWEMTDLLGHEPTTWSPR